MGGCFSKETVDLRNNLTSSSLLILDPIQTYDPSVPQSIKDLWLAYKDIVSRINEYIDDQQYERIASFEIIDELDRLVRMISKGLIEAGEDPSTILFYQLPLSLTSAPSKDPLWKEFANDHRVISNPASLFLAFRNDASYFTVIIDHKMSENGLETTVATGDSIIKRSAKAKFSLSVISDLNKISDVEPVNNPIGPQSIGGLWQRYKNIASRINGFIEKRQYKAVKLKEVINDLDCLVRTISKGLIENGQDPTTILFYDLPLSLTSAPSKDPRWQENTHDHWVIADSTGLFVAYRQDAAYFIVIINHKLSKNLLVSTVATGDSIVNFPEISLAMVMVDIAK